MHARSTECRARGRDKRREGAHPPSTASPLSDSVPPSVLEGLPESAHPWFSYNADRDRREMLEDLRREMVDALAWIMADSLSQRQRDVLQLHYVVGLTEVDVAAILRISQPTVSQHLTGKKRGRKKVGGALAKLRKAIRRAVVDNDQPPRRRQIVAVLQGFLEGPPTLRHGARLFNSLRTAADASARK